MVLGMIVRRGRNSKNRLTLDEFDTDGYYYFMLVQLLLFLLYFPYEPEPLNKSDN